MKSVLMGFLGAGAIGAFAVCGLCQPEAVAASARPAAINVVSMSATNAANASVALTRVTLLIEGMTCGGCAIGVRTVLQRLQGVEKVEVSYEKKTAVVTYDPARITPKRMIAALKEKLGYVAQVREEGTT